MKTFFLAKECTIRANAMQCKYFSFEESIKCDAFRGLTAFRCYLRPFEPNVGQRTEL